MKKIIAAMMLVLLSACATVENTQASYVKSCATYSVLFETAYQMRVAGKLSKAEIESVSSIDAQITPICTGKLPVDVDAATAQVTAAVTTLTILEVAKKASK